MTLCFGTAAAYSCSKLVAFLCLSHTLTPTAFSLEQCGVVCIFRAARHTCWSAYYVFATILSWLSARSPSLCVVFVRLSIVALHVLSIRQLSCSYASARLMAGCLECCTVSPAAGVQCEAQVLPLVILVLATYAAPRVFGGGIPPHSRPDEAWEGRNA